MSNTIMLPIGPPVYTMPRVLLLFDAILQRVLPSCIYFRLKELCFRVIQCLKIMFQPWFFSVTSPQPWFTYPAIAYLNGRDLSQMDVFEFGAGYSTAYFSKMAKSVLSVDDNAKWIGTVRQMAGDNSEVILATTKEDYLAAISKRKSYDLIVVDGMDWRFECAMEAIKFLRPGGMIIVDNADFPGNTETANYLQGRGMHRVDFWGYTACYHRVIDTCILFDVRKLK